MVMIRCRSCCSMSSPGPGVLSSGHAMALHMSLIHASRRACRSSPFEVTPVLLPGAVFATEAARLASSVSANASAS